MAWRFGDLAVDSDVPFDPLPQTSAPPDLSVRRDARDTPTGRRIQAWADPAGGEWLVIERLPASYLLRFPDLTCELSDDGTGVRFQPSPRLSDDATRHLLLHQVLPLAASRTGRFVLHACAVETPRGAVAFVGQSGSGKSTLAAGFCRRGSSLVADDALMIDITGTGAAAWPTADGVRLWNDMQWLVPGAPPPTSGWDKLHVAVPLADSRVPLVRMYETTYSAGDAVEISPLPAASFRLAVLANLFRVDVEDEAESRALFDRVHELLSRVPARQLAFQDGEHYMDAVYAAVLEDLAS